MNTVWWKIYGVIIALFSLLGLAVAIINDVAIVITLISSTIVGIYLTGLYGYVSNKAIWSRFVWRACFVLNIIGVGFKTLSVLLASSLAMSIDGAVSIALSVPMIIALYKYSSPNFPAWGDTQYGKLKFKLAELLENNDSVSSASVEDNKGTKHTVEVFNQADEVSVRIIKGDNDSKETFMNPFDSLELAANFIERNTPVRAGDFV